MHQLIGAPASDPDAPVLTIILNPVHSKRAPYPQRCETLVRAVCRDETVLPTRWFPTVMDFTQYALSLGWRWRFRCIVHVTPHPADVPPDYFKRRRK